MLKEAWSGGSLPFVGSNMSESSFGKSNTGRKSTANTLVIDITASFRES